jgi:hypothetical protein
MSRRLFRLGFAILVFAALALAITSRPKRMVDFDQTFYLTTAYDLVHHHVFSNGIFDEVDSTIAAPPPGMFFSPLYPWLIVGAMKVDPRFARAVDCTIEANEKKRDLSTCEIYPWPMHLLHALLLTVAVLAMAYAGAAIVSRRLFYPIAMVATLGVAAEAELFSYIMTESLWLALYSVLAATFVTALKSWRRRDFAAVGLILGALCLARVSFLVLAPVLVGIVVVYARRRMPRRAGWGGHVAALTLALLVLIVPWMTRNAVSLGRLALSEEYGAATLIERFAFNDMRAREYALAFPYCIPVVGPALVGKVFGADTMHRFEWDEPGTFFALGRARRNALVAEHRRLDPIIMGVVGDEMAHNGWRYLATMVPLAWCGLWVGGLWSVIAFPLFVCACVTAARERNGLFFLYALPAFVLVGMHAALANHDTRYNIDLIGPFSIGAAWMVMRIVARLRGARLADLAPLVMAGLVPAIHVFLVAKP